MHEIFANSKLLKGPLNLNGRLGKGKKSFFSVEFNPGGSTKIEDDEYDCLKKEEGSILALLLDSGALIESVDTKRGLTDIVNQHADDVQKAQAELMDAEDKLACANKEQAKEAKARVNAAKKAFDEAKKAAKKAAK